ncbi:MAG: radical SAM protein, partial [Bacteroidales bacterium]
ITWTCQSSFDVARDEELLNEMAEAGCRFIVLGLESVNPESIKETRKLQNKANEYIDAIRRINRAGIQVYSSFIVGFDHDTLVEFDNIYRFSYEAELVYVMVSLLGTHKGTDLHERIKKEGRILRGNRKYLGGMFPVVHYMQMSQLDLFDRYYQTLDKLFQWESIRERAVRLFEKGFFTRKYRSDQSGFFFKLRMTFILLWIYLLKPGKAKRKLFLEIIGLIKRGKIAIESAAIFLVTMEGFRWHLRILKKHLPEFRAEIKNIDKGPWKGSMLTK